MIRQDNGGPLALPQVSPTAAFAPAPPRPGAPAWHRLTRTWFVILLAISTTGCSTARVAYDNAPWLLVRAMDDYLDLDRRQAAQAQAALRHYHEQHRKAELPAIIAALNETSRRAEDGLDDADWDWFFTTSQDLYERTTSGLAPVFALTLADLRPEQIDHFAVRLAESNAEFRDKFLTGTSERRLSNHVERVVDRAEDWVGELDRPQVSLIRQMRTRFPDASAQWQAYKESQQVALLESLRAGRPAGVVAAQLTGWLVRLDGMSPQLAQRRILWLSAWRDLMSALDQSLSDEQRLALRDQLEAYASGLAAASLQKSSIGRAAPSTPPEPTG